MSLKIPYTDLVEVFFESKSIEGYLIERYEDLQEDHLSLIAGEINRRFKPHFTQKLKSVHYSKRDFRIKYLQWLNNEFLLEIPDLCKTYTSELCNRSGRPRKSFEDCGPKAQTYKIREIKSKYSQAVIDAAASSNCEQPILEPNVALALITQAKLSRDQYEVIRKATHDLGYKIFPSYKKIQEAKKNCYPDNVNITEISAEVPLQCLLDHTAKRIFKTLEAQNTENLEECAVVLHTKWGCDGASGQSEFKQKYSEIVEDASDEHLFMTSLVPLKITLATNQEKCVWKNPRPSSTNYCRVLKFQYRAETPELIKAEKQRIDNEIKELCDTKLTYKELVITIKHKLYFTMLDGKVAQVVTDTPSASNCIICQAKPSQLNDLSRIGIIPTKEEAIQLGMSPLHARIRFMEYILKLGYNLEFKAWRTSATTKPLKDQSKKRIQNEFQEKLGLKIDHVKQGTGTTNDGNTSRRFFENHEITAEITKIDTDLIRRLATILEVICCQYPIDSNKFRVYAGDTAKLAILLYPWYKLPATVHKILFHGAEIIENTVLPIGALSEEAQESRNKDYKYFRTYRSRKCSRSATNTDIFNMIMISSDPVITQLRPVPKKKLLPLSEQAKELIL